MEVLKGGNAPLHMVLTSPYFRSSEVNKEPVLTDAQRADRNRKHRERMKRQRGAKKCIAR